MKSSKQQLICNILEAVTEPLTFGQLYRLVCDQFKPEPRSTADSDLLIADISKLVKNLVRERKVKRVQIGWNEMMSNEVARLPKWGYQLPDKKSETV